MLELSVGKIKKYSFTPVYAAKLPYKTFDDQ